MAALMTVLPLPPSLLSLSHFSSTPYRPVSFSTRFSRSESHSTKHHWHFFKTPVCNLKLTDDGKAVTSKRMEEDLTAVKNGEFSKQQVVDSIDEALQGNYDAHAVALASTLRTFGGAAMVPQRLYSLEELRLNKIDAAQLLSPTDATLGNVKRNLQIAAIVGGLVAWKFLGLDQFQLLTAAVAFLFLGTLDQVANGGGLEALLLDSFGRILSSNYKDRVAQHEAGHFLVSHLIGILPKTYTLSSLEAFRTYGALNIQAGTTFVDFDFQQEVKSGKLSSQTLNKFSCVALAGVASEYLLYGVAEGGLADIQQLDAILKGLRFTQQKADSQVRWAVLNTISILRRQKGLHAKLAAAMLVGKSVGGCILLIENELSGSNDI